MLQRFIYTRQLKKARKAALKLSALSMGKRYYVIQFNKKPEIFDKVRIEAFKRAGVFRKNLNAKELCEISLFITPKLSKNVYYKG